MKEDTKNRKKASGLLKDVLGPGEFLDKMDQVIAYGKPAADELITNIGRMVVEAIMEIERQEIAGPDYHPKDSKIKKWASEGGSVFIGDKKIKVNRPRLRNVEDGEEIPLKSYTKLKEKGHFGEELLRKSLIGMSGRRYQETVQDVAQAFGISPSSVSRHLVDVTTDKLKEFQERSLKDFNAFCIFLDTIHIGSSAFIVALGIDIFGNKRSLGFWEGASENHEICNELLSDLEKRGMVLSRRILWVTDGGKGIIKSLRDKFGKKLVHQRCTIHKNNNIQKHLPKKYRGEASNRFKNAIRENSYEDAKKKLKQLVVWLRDINDSAADSLLEALEEVLTVHRLKVNRILRRSLHSTNPIESMFSGVRGSLRKIKRMRGGDMGRRWVASAILDREKKFEKVKGFQKIKDVIDEIEYLQDRGRKNSSDMKMAA